jgi:HD-GYP domain-containing protein (c-di-GMP phosphodiesterase class II)
MELEDKITALEKTLSKLRLALEGTIKTLTITSEAKDPYTAGHQRRVSDLARAIAQEMGLPENVVDGIRMAGLIHDLGKIGVPGEILGKPTKLSDLEFHFVRAHP